MKNFTTETVSLKNEIKRLKCFVKLLFILWGVAVGYFLASFIVLAEEGKNFDHLRVRQITVVDEKGVDRIYIGSPIPDPLVNGRRVKRKEASTGITMNDENGNERNGWGVFPDGGQNFCLDYSKGKGEALCLTQGEDRAGIILKDVRQNFSMFLGRIGYNEAEPKLFLFDSNGIPRIKLQAESEDGTPKIELVDKNGKSFFLISDPANK